MTVQELTSEGLRAIGPIATTLAELEGLDAHARAVTRRLAAIDATGAGEPAMSVLDLARPELRAIRPYVPGQWEPGLRASQRERIAVARAGRHDRARPERLPAASPDDAHGEARGALRHRAASDPRDARQQRGDRRADPRLLRRGPRLDPDHAADVRHVSALRDDPERRDQARAAASRTGTSRSTRTPCSKASTRTTKIVFLCSPNNPTGQSLARADVERICRETAGRALVVLDEAYHEFAEAEDFAALRARYEHVVLLRTLSKFVSLAGVRCGLLIAAPQVIEFSQNVLPPYTFPTPSIEHVRPGAVDRLAARVRRARRAAQARARALVGGARGPAAGPQGLSERRELRDGAGRATARRSARPRTAPACSCGRSTIRCWRIACGSRSAVPRTTISCCAPSPGAERASDA